MAWCLVFSNLDGSIAWPCQLVHASSLHTLIPTYPNQAKFRWTLTKVITLTQTVVFGDSWGTTAIDPCQNDPKCGFGRGTLRDWARPHDKTWQDSLTHCTWFQCCADLMQLIRFLMISKHSSGDYQKGTDNSLLFCRALSRSLSSLLVVCCLSRRAHTHSHWNASNKI
jgi:hypothetical protein